MNLAGPFIRRPVMTTLVMLAILLAGIAGYRQLPVSDLPTVDFPTIQVSANLPGASPETMASSVALPLERQFSTIAGVESMSSTNSQGETRITLQFALDRDIDAAAQDVQTAIAQASRRLPEDMPSPPSYRKVNPADQPILYLSLTSDVLPLSTIDEYADTFIAQRISTIQGVAQVQVNGSQKYAVRVRLDPSALATRGIGIDEVTAAIRAGNTNLPIGNLEGPDQAFTIKSSGQLLDAEAYRGLIVAYRNGSPVRLNEVGSVIDSVENDRIASWLNDTRAITLGVLRQPGTNTVEVVDRIRTLLPTFEAQMPPAIKLGILYDRSESIRASVHEVQFTLLLTIVLVVLVIFLFLRTITATIIPSLALPMSIIGTFSIMYLFDYSIDNLSLMALTLSVGFVVDDAIVVLENIVRHRELGEDRMTAALNGSREIGFTIISMTISLAAVFLPVLFMGGILGRLLREFAVTISVAILISGVISLTLTPMLCSRFLRAGHGQRHGWLYNLFEKFFDALLAAYRWSLTHTMRHRWFMMLVSAGLLALTIWQFKVIPKGFLPSEDTGRIFMQTEAAQGVSSAAMMRLQQELAGIVLESPHVASLSSSVTGGNTGRIFMTLVPREQRPGVDQVIHELRPKLGSVPGIRGFMQNPPSIRIGGQMSKSQYQFTLQSPDTEALYQYAPRLEERLRQVPGLTDVTSDLQNKNPEVHVDIDRDKASTLGISARQIEDALASAYGQRQISTFYTAQDTYQVVLELDPQYRLNPSLLSLLYIRANGGELVPLSTIASLRNAVGPLSVNHLGQLPAVTLSFNILPGVSLGEAVDAVQRAAGEVLPASISTSFQGTAQAFEASVANLGWLLLAAILVIYIVLGILYESFIHPLTILSGLPSAGVGALAALMLFDMELDLYSFVGIIMLVGIVKKNAIMMIDFALETQREHGKTPAEAIFEGALVRFRPIMMTTMAALMGGLPIAMGYGSAGAESRQPLGMAIVGGLLVSQLLTLYITPVFYTYMEALRRIPERIRSAGGRRAERRRARGTPTVLAPTEGK